MYQRTFQVYDAVNGKYTTTYLKTMSISSAIIETIRNNLGPSGAGNGIFTVDPLNSPIGLYIDDFGTFNLASHWVSTGQKKIYLSPTAYMTLGQWNSITDVNSGLSVSLDWVKSLTEQTAYSTLSLGQAGNRSDYPSTWICVWPYNSTHTAGVICSLNNDGKYYFRWVVQSMSAEDNFWKHLTGGSVADNDIEYDEGVEDDTSDDIGLPSVPPVGILSTSMVHAYKMSSANMVNLAAALWDISGNGFIDTLGKFFNNPSEAIISINILPVAPTVSSSAVPVKIGNWTSNVISAPYVTDEYLTISCGTLNWTGYYGSYADYGPYTQCEIFLPFIGVKSLAIEDVANANITLTYRFNVLTGVCVAYIQVQKTGKGESKDVLNSLIYQFHGNCSMQAPTSATDYASRISSIIQGISSVANGIATATSGDVVGGIVSGSTGAANAITTAQLHYRVNGSLSADSGMLSSFKPYLIISKPNLVEASSYNRDIGKESRITGTVGSLSGFNRYENIHITGCSATDAEKEEIKRVMKEGIIV